MKYGAITQDSLFLEDFDVQGLFKVFPDYEIGVRINAIYAQIAKFSGNPHRTDELKTCLYALKKVENDKFRRYKYTTMTLQDVIKCFGNDLKKMPIGSFVQSTPLGANYLMGEATTEEVDTK